MVIKQVIAMRTDLNMRKGKMVAQGAHASIAFLTEFGRNIKEDAFGPRLSVELSTVEAYWIRGRFTKICVGVGSEEELFRLVDEAEKVGIKHSLILDDGLTEFGGTPTYTCAAFGPDLASKLDPLTGHLRLL